MNTAIQAEKEWLKDQVSKTRKSNKFWKEFQSKHHRAQDEDWYTWYKATEEFRKDSPECSDGVKVRRHRHIAYCLVKNPKRTIEQIERTNRPDNLRDEKYLQECIDILRTAAEAAAPKTEVEDI